MSHFALLTYRAELPWATSMAAALRRTGSTVEAWVLDGDDAVAARRIGAFDDVTDLTAGFRRAAASDARPDDLWAAGDDLDRSLGGPLLHRLASIDRAMSGYDHIEVPPMVIRDRWTWAEVVLLALHIERQVAGRVVARRPAALVGEWGGFGNRLAAAVCQREGIPTLGAQPLPYYPGRVFFPPGLGYQWPEAASRYRQLLETGVTGDLASIVDETLERIRSGRTLPIPRLTVDSFLPSFSDRFGPSRIANAVRDWRVARSEERRDALLQSYPELVAPLKRVRRKGERRLLRRDFDRVALRQLPDQPFAVYFLHSQPEITVDGWSFDFSDQPSTVQAIAGALPAGLTLLVKEQSHQAGIRDRTFYGRILAVPGVRLLHDSLPVRDVVRQAEAVLTLTGTVSMESMCLGVPAVILGSAYYEHFAGIRRVRTHDELRAVLADLGSLDRASDDEVRAAMAARYECSYPGGWLYGGGGEADADAMAATLLQRLAEVSAADEG